MQSGSPWWIKLLLGLFGLILVGVAALYGLGTAATHRWNDYAASLRAKGQPLTFEEIEARRAVISEEQNSARVIERLADRFEALGDYARDSAVMIFGGRKGHEDFFDGIGRSQVEASRQFLDKRRELLDGLEALRDKPAGRFDIQYDKNNPIMTLLPHVTRLRTASKLLHLDAMIRLVDGDREGAVLDFELQSRTAGTLFDEPVLISRLVQIAIEAQACQTVEEILRVGEVSNESLVRMTDELAAMKKNGTMRWGLLGERALFIDMCEALLAGRAPLSSLDKGGYGASDVAFLRVQRLPSFLVRSNQLSGTKMYTSLIDAENDILELGTTAARLETEKSNLPGTQVLVRILVPGLTRSMTLHAKISAQLECTIAGIAAEGFRTANGRLPASLGEMVPQFLPAIPIDPFDGQPLRFATTDDGIVIYSIDMNLIDDGGDVGYRQPSRERQRAPDLGFRLFHLDRRGVLLVDDPPSSGD